MAGLGSSQHPPRVSPTILSCLRQSNLQLISPPRPRLAATLVACLLSRCPSPPNQNSFINTRPLQTRRVGLHLRTQSTRPISFLPRPNLRIKRCNALTQIEGCKEAYGKIRKTIKSKMPTPWQQLRALQTKVRLPKRARSSDTWNPPVVQRALYARSKRSSALPWHRTAIFILPYALQDAPPDCRFEPSSSRPLPPRSASPVSSLARRRPSSMLPRPNSQHLTSIRLRFNNLLPLRLFHPAQVSLASLACRISPRSMQGFPKLRPTERFPSVGLTI